jgi:hypothetical protein
MNMIEVIFFTRYSFAVFAAFDVFNFLHVAKSLHLHLQYILLTLSKDDTSYYLYIIINGPRGILRGLCKTPSQKTVGIKGNQIIILIKLSNKRGKVKKISESWNKTFWAEKGVGGWELLNLT